MALPWREVAKKKRYQGLSPDDRRNAQDEYFEQNVGSRLEDPAEKTSAHREFLTFAADLDKGAAPARRAPTSRPPTPRPRTRTRARTTPRARGKPPRPTGLAQVEAPEELRGFGEEAVSALKAGGLSTMQSLAGLGKLIKIPGSEEAVEFWEEKLAAPSMQRPEHLQEETVIQHPERLVDWRWWTRTLGENLPNMLAMMAPGGAAAGGLKLLGVGAKGIARGAVGGSLAGAFGIESGSAFNQALAEGAPEGVARMEAVAVGGINSLLEVLPFADLLQAPARGLLKQAVRTAMIEGGTESIQEAVNIVAEEIGHKDDLKDPTWKDIGLIGGRIVEAGLTGMGLGGGVGIVAGGYKRGAAPPTAGNIDATLTSLMDQVGMEQTDTVRQEMLSLPLQEKIQAARELQAQLGQGPVAPSGMTMEGRTGRPAPQLEAGFTPTPSGMEMEGGPLEGIEMPSVPGVTPAPSGLEIFETGEGTTRQRQEGELPTQQDVASERALDITTRLLEEQEPPDEELKTASELASERAGVRPSRRRRRGLEGIPIVEGASEPLIYMMEGRPAEIKPEPDILATSQELAMQGQRAGGLASIQDDLRQQAKLPPGPGIPPGPPLSKAGFPLVQGLERLEQPEAGRLPPPSRPSELKQPPPLSATERLHPSVEEEVAPTPKRAPRVKEEVEAQRAEDRQSFIDEIGREPKGAEKALLRRGAVEKAIEYGRRKVSKTEFEQERERNRVERLEEEAGIGEAETREEAPVVPTAKEVEPTPEPAPLESKKEVASWENIQGSRVRFNPPETRTEAGPSFGIEIQQSGAGRIPTKTLEDAGFEWDNFGKTWHAEDTKKTRAFVESLPAEVPPETPVSSAPAPPRTRFDEIKEARAERLEERAEKAEGKAKAGFKRSADILDVIPAGQPVLKGHHSEARHRRDLAKADRGIRTGVEESKKAEELRSSAEKARTGKAVSSADPNAIPKLEEKLAGLEAKQARMKEINAAWKKGKEKVGELKLSPEELKEIEGNFKFAPGGTTKPFPGFALTNNNAGISNIKKRIETLGVTAAKPAETIELPGLTIDITKDPIGIDLHYTEKPSEETRAQIKQGGFRWAPSRKVWHAKDNPRSRAVVDQLQGKAKTGLAPTGEAASRVIDTLKGQEGTVDFQTKAGRQIFSDLVEIGQEIITQGKRSYKEFTATFKEHMGEHWDKVKGVARRVWAAARKPLPGVTGPSERGAVGRRPRPERGTRVEPPAKLTPEKLQELRKTLMGISEKVREETKYTRPASINVERQAGLPEEMIQFERELADMAPRKTVSHPETIQAAINIANDQKKAAAVLRKAKAQKALDDAELNAVRYLATNGMARVKELTEDNLAGRLSDTDYATEVKKFNETLFKVSSDANSLIGRTLSSLRIQGKTLLDAGHAMARLGRDLNEREKQELHDLDPDNPVEIVQFIDRLGDPTLMDYTYEFLYNNMLSGVPTHIVNAASNTLWASFQIPHRIMTAGADRIVAKLKGRPQQVFMSEVLPMLAGYKKGLKRGAGKALEVVKTGELLEQETKWAQEMGYGVIGAFSRSPSAAMRKMESFLPVPGTGVKLGITSPTRALRAMDVWANAAGYDAQMGALALRAGKKQGLKGNDLKTFQREFLADPPEAATKEAADFARYSTFMDEPGKISSWLLRGREDIAIDVETKLPKWVPLVGGAQVGKIKPGFFVIPFVRTIGNLLKRGLEMTPVVGVGLARGQTPAQVVAKQIEGVVIMMTVLSLIDDDRITGALPEKKTEREAFYRQGKKPWSIRMGDTWVQYRRIEPFNTVIASVALAYEKIFEAKDEDTVTEILMNTAKGLKDNLIDSSYMQGVQNVLDRHGRTKGMLQRQAATLVPFSSFWRSINRAVEVATEGETKVRETKSFLGAFSQVIPGLSGKMPARLNVWGEEIVMPGGIFRQWLPVKWAKETDDPVEKVLEKIGVYPGLPGKHVAIKGVRTELDDDIYRSYLKSYGSKAKRLLGKRVKLLNRIKDPLTAQKMVDKMLRQIRGVELRRAKRKQLLKDRREKKKARKD